jgi:MFS family permease
LINGFCESFVAFNLARAMSGIGGALIIPNAVAMIGVTCPPCKARNLLMGFFGASAPIEGAAGGVLAGAVLEFGHSKWMFFAM